MDAKQIEYQVAANQREALQIQAQLIQMENSNPQRQALTNRLEMINRAQTYWATEYFRLTGKSLNLPPMKITVKTAPSAPAPSPFVPDNNSTEKGLLDWKIMREKIRASLIGNPNRMRLESYLDILEKNAGNRVPKIPDIVIFGNAIQGNHGGPVETFNGTPMSNNCFSFEDSDGIVLQPNGSVMTPTKQTLIVVYRNRNHYENDTPPKIEVHGTDLGDALKALGGG
jgi:hypothetical protein